MIAASTRMQRKRASALLFAAWFGTVAANAAPPPSSLLPPKGLPSPLPAVDLRVEYAAMPVVGVQTKRPRFGWTLVQAEGVRGTLQSAYSVQVSTAKAATTAEQEQDVVWDSKTVQSNNTIGIQCGVDLMSDTTYTVTVQWTDQAGQHAPPATASFSTSLLSPSSDWKEAKWISLASQNDTRNQFRGTITIPSTTTVARAACYISGLGYHRSYLNGVRLSSTGNVDDTLGPFLQFQRRTPYDAYDVTNILRPGKNTLASLLGFGWYALPDNNGFVPVLGYKTADGQRLQFDSGGVGATLPFRHASGELVSDHLFLGETIDKRLETPNWQSLGYDDSHWDWAIEVTPPTPLPPLPPPAFPGLECPAGQRVDYVVATGDNGSCDCDRYCASDWAQNLHTQRPKWSGATSVSNSTSSSPSLLVATANAGHVDCYCVQATHWCPRTNPKISCGAVCTAAGVALPQPSNYCTSSRTPPPPPPTPPVQQEVEPQGIMTSFVIPPVRRHEPRAPTAIRQSPSGSWVFDFELNQAMQCTLKIETDGTEAGTALRLHHAEQVASDGSIVISNDLGGVEDRTTFILGPAAGVQTFETQFAYFGARFVDVAGWPEDRAPTEDSMVCYFVHTALPQRSSIHFEAPVGSDTAVVLNGIHEITLRSALSNFMSTPTDCPSREKRGWTGDGQAAAETLIYSFDMATVYPKWLGDIADAQQCNFDAHKAADAAGATCSDEEGPWCRLPGDAAAVTEMAPYLFGGHLDACTGGGDPAWSSGYIAVIDWVHRYYGNLQVLEHHYNGGAAYLNSLLPFVNTNVSAGGTGLLDLSYTSTRYGDWCAPLPAGGVPVGRGISARHTSNLINGFFWIKQLRIMAAAAKKLGKAADAAMWSKIVTQGEASYSTLYFDSGNGLFKDIECSSNSSNSKNVPCHNIAVDSEMSVQTAQALPLFLGLPTDSAADRKRAGDALANDVLNGTFPGRTTTGLVGTKYVLSELVNAGHADVALQMATATGYPSWGRMLPPAVHPLGQGEGTLWEQFGGDMHHGFGSRNHIMLGGFDGPYLYGNLAGIQNDGVAFDAITIAPTVAGDLQAVTATVGTARGDVTVHWQHAHEVCAVGFEGELKSLQPAVVNCSARGIISKIKFASYGNPTGGCGNWTAGCAAKQSLEVVEALCVGKAVCSVNASNAAFNTTDPCPGIPKTLAIEAECSSNFAMQTAIPVGSTATVRLPLIPPTSAAANVTVKEGGVVVFAAGSFKAGAVHGVLNASADETLAGKVVAVTVTSGNYQWTIE